MSSQTAETAERTPQTGFAGQVVPFARRFVVELVALNLLAGWLLLWGNVDRLNLTLGHPTGAGITLVLFIVPVVVAYLWHLGGVLSVRPDLSRRAPW